MGFIKYSGLSLLFLLAYYSTSIHPLLKKTGSDFSAFHFTSQGQALSMRYVYEKPADTAKATVVLLHGKNFDAAYWQSTINYLTQKGYSVLAPEQLGFGGSSQPNGYQYSFQQLAQNTKQLLDTLHISQAVVLGHSMGGMLAVRFALMYPAACSRLILEDPIGLEDWKTAVPYSTVDEQYVIELKKTRQDLKEYMTKNYFHDEWKPEYEPLLDESAKFLKQGDFKDYAKNMALTTDMIFTQPVCYEFKNVKVPVTLIVGEKDKTAIGKERVSPEAAKRLGHYPKLGKKAAAAMPHCKLIVLKGLGHIPHIENFQVFTETLQRTLNHL